MSTAKRKFRYQQLAKEIEEKIHSGTYKIGEKLPSTRDLHKRLNLSITTIYKAFIALETKGLIEARPKSGYYVKSTASSPKETTEIRQNTPQQLSFSDAGKEAAVPHTVEIPSFVNEVLKAANNTEFLQLGSAVVSPEFLPFRQLSKILKEQTSSEMKSIVSYELAQGDFELRRQLALRALGVLDGISADDFIITNGCTEAMLLALKAVVQAGDTIAIESPTFYGILPLLEELKVLVVEIPTDPVSGLNIDKLEKSIKIYDIKACLLTPNFHNPLGALMPVIKKIRLVQLLNRYNIPIIEDNVLSELYYGKQPPAPLKAFDEKDLTLTCSSFSKSLTSGLRIGWIIPGNRFKERVLKLKAGFSVSTSSLDQFVLARFLESGVYERHLRSLRARLKKQVTQFAEVIEKHFLKETRFVLPQGGLLLWVQLPDNVDGLTVYRQALEHRIAILPGSVCSSSGQFKNYIRIGCGFPLTQQMKKGLMTLGKIVEQNQK